MLSFESSECSSDSYFNNHVITNMTELCAYFVFYQMFHHSELDRFCSIVRDSTGQWSGDAETLDR